ncbi:MAG TPA: TonB family protein [Pyrinomonadaceae bacterium]|nr:TonB family protein [Pyrinomonadaceae bacterium]
MSKRLNLTLLLALLPLGAGSAEAGVPRDARALRLGAAHAFADAAATEREQDGLAGPVRRVKTETAKITVKGGQPSEGPRQVLETTTYDQKGNRVDNAYFLAAGGSLTGKEVYKYDSRGNIVEMTLHNDDGTLLAKEVYTYEYDAVGNWVKMTTSVAVMEGGKVTFEPSEVTYRTISYYLDQTVLAKMSQPGAPAPAAATPAPSNNAPAATAPNTAAANAQPQPVSKPQTPAGNSNNTTAAQPRPSPAAPAKSAPARNTAAPLMVASLDRSMMTGAPAASSVNVPMGAGPSVKSEGEAPAAAPPVSAAPPARSGPLKPVSAGVLNGKAISLPMPVYPAIARNARAFGLVEVEVVIDINGKVISAKATSGPAFLRQSAEMAARQARFSPTLLSGQPVRVSGVITYNFTLQP